MPAPLQHVQSGDRLAVPASTFNTMIDAGRDYLARQRGNGRTPQIDVSRFAGGAFCRVRNEGPGDRGRFDGLGLSGVVIEAEYNLRGFQQTPVFRGVPGVHATHNGRCAILQEPLAGPTSQRRGRIGWAILAGVTACRLQVVDEGHTHAYLDGSSELADADVGRLKSGFGGPAEILYKPEGTGEQWALVLLGSHTCGTYVGRLVNALTAVSETCQVNEVEALNGPPPVGGDELTVYNTHRWAGRAGALVRFHWSMPNERLELFQEDC